MSAVLDEKLDSVYSDLHYTFETLSDHDKKGIMSIDRLR